MGNRTTKTNHKVKVHKTVSCRADFFYYAFRNVLLVSVSLLIFSVFIFTIPHSSATISDSSADSVTLTLSTSCTLSSSVLEAHNANLNGGQYKEDIGNTRINAYCNDNNGYNIYAIGYSGDIDGNTELIGESSSNYNIATGIYNPTGSNNSSLWSMKLTPGSGSDITSSTPPTINNGYDSYNVIPNVYTLVASRASGTNMTIDTDITGSYFNTTYAIYASSVQPADTYIGKVKYLMTHPNTNAPSTINDIDAAFAVAGKQKVYQDEESSYYAMQDMTTDICNLVTRTGESTTSQLVDIRDNNLYFVTKEKDGHCWMTQNLDLDINGENTKPLNSENTDISTTASGSGIYSTAYGYSESNGVWTWTPDTTTASITVDYDNNTVNGGWNHSSTLPYSADGGDTYIYTSDAVANDTVYTSLATCEIDHIDCKHYHVGNYYNWAASIASNNSTGFNTQYDNAANSICPKGWRLPITTNNDQSIYEFGELLFKQGIITSKTSTTYTINGFANIRKSPLWLVRSGTIYGSELQQATLSGYYRPSTVRNSDYSYGITFTKSSAASANAYDARYSGNSIRCLTR